ncbi:Zn(2)-C6 fungal-type DNA-binding domain protein [Akanthomyces lecanii RCEF 1005]|uniref:Zn(2)-C6 fungal-type DNA-binding domain protein n=1 Tax=Akanthomyces lecanii RCEF 1005 TaxID=1081108 RepID=A0A162MTS4_CORDF|nr:Zn(2)-C6 fungal-type DNA-binding domain protein [Akanthomyces lecanii RCEF 1005]
MVGVAGRSKACLDCKRRRVKCDLTEPRCLRCSRAKIHCQGYKLETIWVNRTLEQPGLTAAAAIAGAARLPQSPGQRRLHLLNQLKLECASPARDPLQFRCRALQVLDGIYTPYLSLEGAYPSAVLWLEAIGEMKEGCDALDQSLLAFCAIQIRVVGENSISYDDTVQLYNHALRNVIEDLAQGKGAREETLAAIIALSTCELFLFVKDQSLSIHAHGISEILRHRDVMQPSRYWDRLVVRMCLICIVGGLTHGRALALAPGECTMH